MFCRTQNGGPITHPRVDYTMTRIVLICPGSTDYDQQKRIQGILNVPLNERGRADVLELVKELGEVKMETIYTSTSRSSLETAEIIARELDVRLKKLDRIPNLNYGLWQGMLVDEVRVKQPRVYRQWQESPECVCPPQGEPLAEADERVHACIARLMKRHKDAPIGLVVPDPLASLVQRCLGGPELGNLWETANGHQRWELFQVHLEEIVSGS
jgi:broad specificity phosphatase PhoE